MRRHGQAQRMRRPIPLMIVALAGSTFFATGCALTHKRAPATQELSLQYSPPAMKGVRTVPATIKVRRFSGLSPFDGTAMYLRRSGYEMESFNYERWVTSPPNLVTDLLYRDLAASHAFRDVFPYLSTEQTRFELEGTVVNFLMLEDGGSWRASLAINVSLIDSRTRQGGRRVVLQRRFAAERRLQGDSPEQYAGGMSDAMQSVAADIIHATHDAASTRVEESEKAPATAH